MDIMQIVAIGLIATVLIVVVKSQRPELGVLLSVVAGIILFLLVLGKIGSIMEIIKDLTARAEINMVYLSTILKIIGIAYIAEFGAQISRDAGESAVATKIEFAAKIMIMVLAVPMIVAVLQMLLKLVP